MPACHIMQNALCYERCSSFAPIGVFYWLRGIICNILWFRAEAAPISTQAGVVPNISNGIQIPLTGMPFKGPLVQQRLPDQLHHEHRPSRALQFQTWFCIHPTKRMQAGAISIGWQIGRRWLPPCRCPDNGILQPNTATSHQPWPCMLMYDSSFPRDPNPPPLPIIPFPATSLLACCCPLHPMPP